MHFFPFGFAEILYEKYLILWKDGRRCTKQVKASSLVSCIIIMMSWQKYVNNANIFCKQCVSKQ